jgi:hypothetical protein
MHLIDPNRLTCSVKNFGFPLGFLMHSRSIYLLIRVKHPKCVPSLRTPQSPFIGTPAPTVWSNSWLLGAVCTCFRTLEEDGMVLSIPAWHCPKEPCMRDNLSPPFRWLLSLTTSPPVSPRESSHLVLLSESAYMCVGLRCSNNPLIQTRFGLLLPWACFAKPYRALCC